MLQREKSVATLQNGVTFPNVWVASAAQPSPCRAREHQDLLTISPHMNVMRPELVESSLFVTPHQTVAFGTCKEKVFQKMILLFSWMTREMRTTINIMYGDGVLDEDNLPSTNNKAAAVVLLNLTAVDHTNMLYPHSAGSEGQSFETIC
jgi:hypothetical protein